MTKKYVLHSILFASLLLVSWTPFQAVIPVAQDPGTPDPALPVGDGWQSTVQQQLEASEYNISWQEQTYLPEIPAAYQAPNRRHNLRTYFTPQGFTIIPRSDEVTAWRLNFSLLDQNTPELVVDANHIDYRRDNLLEWYTNDPGGLLQGFTFSLAPENGDPIKVDLALSGDLLPALNPEGTRITFSDSSGNPLLFYEKLLALDAAGNALTAHMGLLNPAPGQSVLRLSLESVASAFPVSLQAVLVSPAPEVPAGLPSSPSWSAESDQTSSYFGWSSSTAGDVNGDGFSDVIVGAYGFDGGNTDEGRAFLYYGSVSGLSATPNWTAEVNQDTAYLGYQVAPAGDVNGDGFYDLLLGAHGYDNPSLNEGKIFLWYGSASGLGDNGTPANADWSYEPNLEGMALGVSLGTAGDVNGDGYSDLVVGMTGYDNGQNDEGAALAFYGSPTGPGAAPNWTVEKDQASAAFGYRVATAGDVNGDGYADVIVGTNLYDNGTTDEGAVWVYHGSASGLSTSSSWFAESNSGNSRFGGQTLNTAGDVNGDGYADIIVGAHLYDYASTDDGAAFLWLGSADGLGANGNPGNADWKAYGNSYGFALGNAVGTAGDVNGDGYADVAIGCVLCWITGASQGAVFVYYGSASGLGASGLPTNADWIGHLNTTGHELGWSAGTAGDVNGDGYSDVIAGARYYDHGQTDEGGVFVWYGSPDGISNTINWLAEGEQAGAALGARAITAGDLNGDGYADVVVGASGYDNGQTDEGAVFVWFGSATGLGANGTTANADWSAESNQNGAGLGYTAGAAGDVNGDGYGDLLVGSMMYDDGQTDEGVAFAWYGSAAGLGANGDPTNADWVTEVNQAGARFSHALARAGDVNGDGFSDVIVGAYLFTNGESGEGTAYVYHGSLSGLSTAYDWMAESNLVNAGFGVSASTAGDLNGDGYSDVIVGAWGFADGQIGEGKAFVWNGSSTGLGSNGTPTNADWKAASDQMDANFGRSVTTAGDVNGDGYSDIIVGALNYDKGQTNEGAAFVWFGSNTGLGADGTPANADWMAESDQAESNFGLVVGNLGDVNGDGYTEVIVGARYYDNGQINEGMVFVWYGSSTGLGANGTPSNPDWKVDSGQVDANLGFGATGSAGDVNGDGYGDVIVASIFYDNGLENEGGAFLFYGNSGPGLALTPQQARSDGLAPIALLGISNSGTSIQLRLTGRTPMGREHVKLEWQVAVLCTPFTGAGAIHGISSTWTDIGAGGVTLSETISGLTPNISYHWRVRLLYHPNRMGQVASRWLHIPWHALSEKDFSTSAAKIYLPLAVRD